MAKKPSRAGDSEPQGLPDKAQILEFLARNPGPVHKRDLARAFDVGSEGRRDLRALLMEMEEAGLIERAGRGQYTGAQALPPVTVIEVTEIDSDGELWAQPLTWDKDFAPPPILVVPDRRRGGALRVGDHLLARLKRAEAGFYEARTLRRLEWPPSHVLGVYEVGAEGGRLRPTNKRAKKDFTLRPEDAGGAQPGELVRAQVLPARRGHRLGLRAVRVVERLGSTAAPRAFSLIAIHEHDIPATFSREALAAAAAAGPPGLRGREDMRALALVTIDGADARDFDDAVFAAPDPDSQNPGGWHLVVAIADVAHYVRPDSALDQEARERGNSVYFPDRVVPMLPEALSNEWCSLKPEEDRATLAVHLWIDAAGKKLGHRFVRGLMRSHARLTYEEVEAHHQALTAGQARHPDLDPRIEALYGAYSALAKARERRGALDIDLPEHQVRIDPDGRVLDIGLRTRLDSHRLIEEFMICANVAAAEELERLRQPCMYRVHEPPDPAKLEALRQVLGELGLSLAKAQVIKPKMLNALLRKVSGRPEAPMVNELMLRAQAQAVYAPHNLGHFGLALRRYGHFTSPIRRYADLLVHRALIAGLALGEGGWSRPEIAELEDIGESISQCERRAAKAEREVVDRYTASYLADRIGERFAGRVSGVTRAGLFVELTETGADGLIPASFLADDRYRFDPDRHVLEGQRWGRVYRLGMALTVRLVEATPLTGGLIFEPAEDGEEHGAAGTEETAGARWDPLRSGGRRPEARRSPKKRRRKPQRR